ncbi:protein translocase subunit SecF [Phycicoccus endophyticus]|uniref:Protein-export membrane protein SecF n=1 Tax=Phycicoccus endophyticus TaxID=1690220 RepID=A0A7G9R4P6_9MICO|nr:protein translocase subunit SecF [Phycicoccus endophyticus]NHI18478.1 protein translocase subunit SecF [Phycicoccus endophyticus]QNN50571.1 protein translocase subunit SecF [Phycicoccus endophyticus]GGL23477.1 protein-export membrane protein SecF [Phycicoccus endophyticus]
MSASFAQLGNDLYTGRRSVAVVAHRRRFYLGSLALFLVAVLGLATQGLNLGLEFRGGSEFRVATSSAPQDYEQTAREAVGAAEDQRGVNVTLVGTDTVRVQTERLSDTDSQSVRSALADAFEVPEEDVSATFIGPSWGASVSAQALRALVIFLVAVVLMLSIYFRNWKMAAAALFALAHDLAITVGIYALVGFEVSPATMIGFLTVLGYSLYDTVVVFDKVRENTNQAFANGRLTYAQAANLAVNQTMVRSINTTVIGLLPISAVLVVGSVFLGPGVLLDLSLVLFVGILVGAYSSIFIATPFLVTLRRKDAAVVELEKKALRHQAKVAKDAEHAAPVSGDAPVPAGALPSTPATREEGSTLTGRAVHEYARSGPRNQPKRTPRSKR